MGETDPREALASTDVAARAAAVRALAGVGDWDDVLRLVDVARQDKSPSVRLYAAAAAADLAMRQRGATGLSAERQEALLARVASYDPIHNPSLLMVLAACASDAGLSRLERLLRDPRQDVRNGAVTALRRMAGALDEAGEARLTARLQGWLAAGRHPPDTVAELVRIAGEVGLPGTEPAIRAASSAGRAALAAVEEALGRFAARRDRAGWLGLWVSRGTDPGEVEGEAAVDWRWIDAEAVHGPDGPVGAWSLAEDGRSRVGDGPWARRIWAGRAGQAGPQEALQLDGRTFWKEEGRAVVKAIDDLDLSRSPAAAAGLADALAPLDGVTAVRARALCCWRAGRLADAEALLAPLLADRPKPDLLWAAANVAVGLGDLDSARAHLRGALEGAPKKAPWRREAELLAASLGG